MKKRSTSDQRTVTTTLPLSQVWIGLLIFYLLVLFLNASALHESSRNLPYGPARRFWVKVSAPLAEGAKRLALDRPRAWLRETIGTPLNNPE